MKQARGFFNLFTLKNVLWQLERQTISNYLKKKVVTRPIYPLLGTNFMLENNKLAHLWHYFIQHAYTGTWFCF